MTYPFLSEEWIEAAKAIRRKYADQHPPVTQVIKVNQVITDVPFGDGTIHSYIDTSDGTIQLELGQLESADVTLTTDWATARAIFALGDQAQAMQAFMSGKIKVQGDMTKLMALQTAVPQSDVTAKIAEEIKQITE